MSNSWDPVNCSPPGSSVHVNSQARILEPVAISYSKGYSQPRDWTSGDRLPTPVFQPGEFHGLCSPWGSKESDMTEQLSLSINKLNNPQSLIKQTNIQKRGHYWFWAHLITECWQKAWLAPAQIKAVKKSADPTFSSSHWNMLLMCLVEQRGCPPLWRQHSPSPNCCQVSFR